MNRVWPIILCLATTTPAAAQMASEAQPEAVSAMERFGMMVGEWEGTSTARFGQGPAQTSRVREVAGFRAGGELLVVEGRGTQEVDGETRVIHDAFGAISYDAASESYRMRSYRAGQGWVDADVVIDGERVEWVLESPAAPIRFRANFSEPDRWIETGEIRRDDQWIEFLRIELDRVGP